TGLDPQTARRVLAPLRAAASERTVLLVTHDPVALEFADRVVHLNDGTTARPGVGVAVDGDRP
ncbi:MAG: ABC transporter ATP-binding protein, partial [Actinomycetota bacterium]|nr:ABC transporter ATP-binding protein [Actinomycetota bacterium]